MSKLLWAIVIIALLIVGYVFFLPKTEVEENNIEIAQEEIVEGIILNIDLEGAVIDGPALVTVSTDGDGEKVVAVPSMGINLCAAAPNIVDVYTLSVGDIVSARGLIDEEGRIVPCNDESHYLRVQETTEIE
jgi:hypothetical protein